MPNEILLGDSPTTIACVTIQSGQAGCRAYFYPSIYKLLLVVDEKKQKFDLGYAGSRLLERLIEFAGDAVGREDLIGYAWPERIVGQGSLNQQIYTLRQILGDEKSRKIIQTLPRRGYLFHPDFVIRTNETLAAELVETVREEPGLQEVASEGHQSLAAETVSIGQELPIDHSVLSAADLTTTDFPVGVSPSTTISTQKTSATSFDWRKAIAALGIIGTAIAGTFYLSLRSEASPVHEQIQIGKFGVVYASHHSSELQQLIASTHKLTTRLVELSRASGTIFWHMAGDYYEALCFSNNASGQALIIYKDQLNQMTDEQLRKCFPE